MKIKKLNIESNPNVKNGNIKLKRENIEMSRKNYKIEQCFGIDLKRLDHTSDLKVSFR